MNKEQYSEIYQKIWSVIKRIPVGKVATYGQIAHVAGLGGQARLVGYALHQLPSHSDVPWHRVINSQGRISLPEEEGYYELQRALLENEQIEFVGDRIDFKKYGWTPEDV